MMKKYMMTLLSLIVIVGFIVGMQRMNAASKKQAYHALDQAVARAINECYANEGQYPENKDYLEKHYHLVYDHDMFTIEYVAYASNIRPTYTIIEK